MSTNNATNHIAVLIDGEERLVSAEDASALLRRLIAALTTYDVACDEDIERLANAGDDMAAGPARRLHRHLIHDIASVRLLGARRDQVRSFAAGRHL